MNDRQRTRFEIARAQYPRVMFWAAGLIVVLSVLNWVEEPESRVTMHGLDAAVAILIAALGLVLLKAPVPASLHAWVFAAAVTAVVGSLVYQAVQVDKPVVFVYIVITMTALGPMVLYWAPFLTSSIISLLLVTLLVTNWPEGHTSEWQLAAVAGVLVGAVLLRMRLAAIDALADVTSRAEHLAVTDELTGLLNRHGLNEQLPRLVAIATRLEKPLFAVFVDIDGLKAANDRHGHAFGDEVIQLSAQALQSSVRGGDLVARWGGDELVVVGIGEPADPEAFTARLDSYVGASGVDRERWPGHLSAGFARGPASVDVEALIEEADHDMYRRRRSARG